ncbi:MAG: HAMP domain-containing protein [Syntrophorhabdales bacterium]|jgi:HAMP domain-containing protein
MAGDSKSGTGLLPRLIVGIFVPILLAFLIIGCMLFANVRIGTFQFASIRGLGLDSMRELGAASAKESTDSLNRLGERMIQQKAEDVATEIEIYAKAHPGKSLLHDPRLNEIAVQRVGDTGYTAVHDNRGINYYHVNPQVVGTDLHDLAPRLPDFVKILDAGLEAVASGYYNWKDADGRTRRKYMVTIPVKGTNLVVAATTYIDEFSRPSRAIVVKMGQMQDRFASQYNQRFTLFAAIVLIDLAVLLAVIYFYSSSVVRPIRHLSEVADRISMGDLSATINIKGKGEVTLLAESIERMQTSVRAAIERLQKRREARDQAAGIHK